MLSSSGVGVRGGRGAGGVAFLLLFSLLLLLFLFLLLFPLLLPPLHLLLLLPSPLLLFPILGQLIRTVSTVWRFRSLPFLLLFLILLCLFSLGRIGVFLVL